MLLSSNILQCIRDEDTWRHIPSCPTECRWQCDLNQLLVYSLHDGNTNICTQVNVTVSSPLDLLEQLALTMATALMHSKLQLSNGPPPGGSGRCCQGDGLMAIKGTVSSCLEMHFYKCITAACRKWWSSFRYWWCIYCVSFRARKYKDYISGESLLNVNVMPLESCKVCLWGDATLISSHYLNNWMRFVSLQHCLYQQGTFLPRVCTFMWYKGIKMCSFIHLYAF